MTLLLLMGAGPAVAGPPPDGAYSDTLTPVTLLLEISTAGALDETQVWLDCSSYLRAAAGGMEGVISIDRGRDSSTDAFKPATMSLWLDNTDRAFDTRNLASPFVDALKARRQIRLRAHAGAPGAPTSDIYTMYRGFVRGWPRRYGEANTFSWVQVNATDGFRIFEQSNLTEGEFTLDDDLLGLLDVGRLGGTDLGEELSGSRIEAIADLATWPTDLRAIDEGLVVVGQQDARSGLDSLQQVEKAEDGYVFIDNDGTLTFLDRLAPWEDARLTTSAATIGPGGDYGYVDIDGVGIDDNRIRNTVRRTGASGIEQSAEDLTSVADYGWATDGPETVIAVSDYDVSGIVETRIRRWAQPVEQITSINLDVIDVGLLLEVMSRRVLDRITVTIEPPGGDPYDPADVLVQGISHQITSGAWTSSYRLGAVPTESLFTLDDDLLGLLDDEALLAP